jgi:Cytochrome P450
MRRRPNPRLQALCKHPLEAGAVDPLSFSLLSDRDFSVIPTSLFVMGSDTIASILYSAFLALVTNSETLHAVHAELNTVIGTYRAPTFDDEKSLPHKLRPSLTTLPSYALTTVARHFSPLLAVLTKFCALSSSQFCYALRSQCAL